MDMKKKKTKLVGYALYILMIVAISTCAIKVIWFWDDAKGVVSNIFSVLSPFIIGMFIAYLIDPLAEFFNKKVFKGIFRIKKRGISRGLGILFSYIIVISVISVCMIYIIPEIIESLKQASGFIESAQTGYNKIVKELTELCEKNPDLKLDKIIDFINKIPQQLEKYIGEIVEGALPVIFSTSVSLISGFINVIIAIIVSVYMLVDKARLINNIKRLIYAWIPQPKADRLLVVSGQCNKVFGQFIIGKMIDSIIIGFLCWIIMTIIGLPYALAISVIVGITNMIPYFGPFIGAVPGVLLLLVVDFYYALIFGLLILVLQQFDGLYLGPKILGESTGLRPIWIIFAITVGGSLAGVTGMFLGVPVTAVIAFLLEEVMQKRLKKNNIAFEEDGETGIISRDSLITEDENLE